MVALTRAQKKISLVLIILVGTTSALSHAFGWFSGRSLESAIRSRWATRQAYSWYLDNNLEEITDAQRLELLQYLSEYKKFHVVQPLKQAVGEQVHDALASACKYAPRLVEHTSYAMRAVPHNSVRTVRAPQEAEQTVKDALSERDYQLFYAQAYRLVKDKCTEEEVEELMQQSYQPLCAPSYRKK